VTNVEVQALLPNVGRAREDDLLRERKGALIYRIAVILAGPVIARLATERRPTRNIGDRRYTLRGSDGGCWFCTGGWNDALPCNALHSYVCMYVGLSGWLISPAIPATPRDKPLFIYSFRSRFRVLHLCRLQIQRKWAAAPARKPVHMRSSTLSIAFCAHLGV
jgi:hypothetical protein